MIFNFILGFFFFYVVLSILHIVARDRHVLLISPLGTSTCASLPRPRSRYASRTDPLALFAREKSLQQHELKSMVS